MKNINLYCPINTTGYGVASLNILKSLNKNKKNYISLTNIGGLQLDNDDDVGLIYDLINRQTNMDPSAPSLKIWHQFDLIARLGSGPYYAYPFFEIDTFNEREKHHLSFPDEIFVSSQWAKDVLLQNGINKPIHIAPLGVDVSIFDHNLINNQSQKYNKYVFITIGKWEIRKSHDLVINLFNQAFDQSDEVELWMITHNPFLSEEEERQWHNQVTTSKLKDKIKIFPRIPNQRALAEIISYASCGIYISRAEGWNLDLIETMAMNKPVIVTNYSAHTEFCNSQNSYLINIEQTEPALDNKWFNGTGNWAKIGPKEQETIVDLMRHLYKNNINTNENGLSTAQKFSWNNTADAIAGCIS